MINAFPSFTTEHSITKGATILVASHCDPLSSFLVGRLTIFSCPSSPGAGPTRVEAFSAPILCPPPLPLPFVSRNFTLGSGLFSMSPLMLMLKTEPRLCAARPA
ncbi:hypothetical protein LMH87_002513 [Akanthomyces muscarius]|uniref:Uncharacterized protein n=1 Tax=Akanthomyces muscarius TaxID=2231603 RepID=A0A9W8Q7V1_AKAMU|nr:hypothetical protein LMH87_002513 [Akanthomyces muscarius]KAJ4148024.1 hypothetical protein LMH87_002513 [Akanthomyces muscarius]